MRRTKEEAEATRLGIMNRALTLFAEQGIAATSLAEIATGAGVTRGAIYWHFKNKWDLFDAIWHHYAGPIEQLGQASQTEEETDPLGKLRQLLRLLLVSVERDEAFRRMIIMCIRESSGLVKDALPERIQAFTEELHQRRLRTLGNAVRKGQLSADLDLEAASLLIKVMVEGVMVSWLQDPTRFSLVERADQFVDSIIAVLRHGARRPA